MYSLKDADMLYYYGCQYPANPGSLGEGMNGLDVENLLHGVESNAVHSK